MSSVIHDSVGAYVTDALEPPERSDFESHLDHCDHCRREVAEFDATLTEYARLAATTPPAGLRERVLAGIVELRPLPPEMSDLSELSEPSKRPEQPERPEPPLAASRPTRAWWSWGSWRSWWPPSWWRPRVVAAAAVATLVVAGGVGGWAVVLDQRQESLAAQQEGVASDAHREQDLLGAPDARVLTRAVGGAQYSFVVSRDRNEALFLGTALVDPGPGRTYQLWTRTGAELAPDLVVPGSGGVRAWLGNDLRDATALAVSIEPEGGSGSPTEIVAVVDL